MAQNGPAEHRSIRDNTGEKDDNDIILVDLLLERNLV